MLRRLPLNFFLFIVCCLLLHACKFRQKADLIIHHARIYTVDDKFSTAEAMVIRDGKIMATGSNDDILKTYEAKEMKDAGGKAIFPGFIDAHCHFTGYATDMWKCDLTSTISFEEILARLQLFNKTNTAEWLYGRGWDQNDWAVKNFPDKTQIDQLFPDKPVFLKRVDGHAALVNQKALDIAGITASTVIAGGSVELKDGKPTGILIDNAMDIVENKVPLLSEELSKQYYDEAQLECFELGLTGVHDCGVSERTIRLVEEEQKTGRLKMKIYALLTDSAVYYDKWISSGPYKTDRLHVGGFKLYADGALGSRGACMLQHYADRPDWSGFLLSDTQHFKNAFTKFAASKLQVCTHAIGDSGNREILKLYAEVLKGKNDRRWRIEHAQVVNNNDFHFFGDYNIIPSVQPTHATSDMYWAADRIGPERVKGAYAYKQLLEQNGWMPLGTDFPVEYISPIKTFFAAVVRQDAKGFPAGGYQMENALTREQTLRGMTIWAARGAFEEKEKGSLEVGKAADFIILDTDLISCESAAILNTQVIATYINGEKVFGK